MTKKTDSVLDFIHTNYEFKNTNNGVFAYVETTDGKTEMELDGKDFRSIIAYDYREATGESIQEKEIRNAVLTLRGKVLKEQPKRNTTLRVNMSKNGKTIRIDMGNSQYGYIKITADGWVLKENEGDKYFTRNKKQSQLPNPKRGGDFNRIFDYCRIPQDRRAVFTAWTIANFIDIIHPCLVLEGEAGSSKSTVSTMLKRLIDPCLNNNPAMSTISG